MISLKTILATHFQLTLSLQEARSQCLPIPRRGVMLFCVCGPGGMNGMNVGSREAEKVNIVGAGRSQSRSESRSQEVPINNLRLTLLPSAVSQPAQPPVTWFSPVYMLYYIVSLTVPELQYDPVPQIVPVSQYPVSTVAETSRAPADLRPGSDQWWSERLAVSC